MTELFVLSSGFVTIDPRVRLNSSDHLYKIIPILSEYLTSTKRQHKCMITIGMDYDVKKGKEDLFVNRFKEVMEVIDSMELHVNTRLFKDVYRDEPSFLVVSEWQSKDGFMEFIKSDVFRATTDWGKEEILRDRPRHKIYRTRKMEGRPDTS